MDQLASSLQSLGLSSVPQISGINAYPTFNQIDLYRSHITELLKPITGADEKVIYSALQWTQTLEYGDLMLPVPALRIKGKKPDELAKEIAAKVRSSPCQLCSPRAHTIHHIVSRLSFDTSTQLREDVRSLLFQA